MSKLTALLIVAGLFASASASGQPSRDWPRFHGPSHDNKSTETGLLKKWPAAGPKLLWTATGIGTGYSSVSVADGTIYTAGTVGKITYVFAFDLDGKLKWKTPNGGAWTASRRQRYASSYAGSRSTPTCDAGRVYHLGELGRLAAFDAKTGREIWSLDLFKTFDATTPKYGLAESVLIDGDRLICSPGGTKGYMVCLEKATGKLIWAAAGVPGKMGYCSARIVEIAGRRQILSFSSQAVFGLDAATGKLLWHVDHQNQRGNNVADPIPHDGCVLASSGYGKGSILIRLKPADGGAVQAETVWASKLLDNHHGGVVLVGSHVYGSGHRARGWFCLDFATGKQAWNTPGKGSLTYADGMLYCLDERGTMSLVEATPDAHRLVSSFPVPKGGRGLHWAHPVVCNARLYVRHADKLFAYDVGAE